ncbi:glycosyltransferase [uncultured Porphyromonas sp.]|uniref:glycosyltransferase family 2 protein n=1 Tax=uncultured Porphyromonas sp. TaxID=159274 RepID=UPI0025EEF548|nr:glycosyltransferase [uncultured Porphyromonas sp.]
MTDHNSLETTDTECPDISVVIPLLNEAESLPELYERIVAHTAEVGLSYEIIFVDDGSSDGSWQVIERLAAQDAAVHGIKFRRNYGKSPALQCGFARTRGRVVFTMDADLQDAPEEIGGMYNMIVHEGYDLVSGWKKKRYDPLSKTIPTKLFNATARRVSGIKNLHDFNCGLKAYRAEVVHSIELYNDMHRYIPYLAKNAGFAKIGEQVVHHAPRKYGHSKFGLDRFFNGYLDLLTLWFTHRFGRKPMHFFGFWGSLMFLVGFIALIVVLSVKFSALISGTPAPLVTDRVYFYISLAAMIIGVQLFCAGFIGEMITRHDPNRDIYNIETEL